MPKNTVYVIGAGASYEIDLPVGNQLKDHIAKILNMEFKYNSFKDGNYDLYQTIRRHTQNNSNETNKYLNECSHIRKNMPLAISIDNFIDSERGNDELALCGKMAIVEAILEAERNSKIFFAEYKGSKNIDFPRLENTWYLPFFRTLTENLKAEELQERFKTITLIIFNYDRCIEHFLIRSLMSYYRLQEAAAAEILSSLKIIHPYGTVGSLPWQDNLSSTSMEYGGELNHQQHIQYAQRIRTFTEGAHSEHMSPLRHSMKNTERLVFLGFAFHRLNMELLMGGTHERYKNPMRIECFATAFETSKNDQDSIKASIQHLYAGEINISIQNTTCAQLFRDNSRSLSYA
ncbi:hypothetical protein [Atopomonas hussainii]|uniref:hypothetical protein n=1 Tax=Atopomonas hussainii TaxID=1429083 RepID=UPI0009002B26|nr:hypothetical protein [Atopomonas hussainii]